MIYPAEIGVVKSGIADIRNEVVRGTGYGRVWRRPKLKQCRRNRIGDGSAFRSRRHSSRTDRRRDLAESFPRTKEKRLVFQNGPAECCAILITVKRGLLSAGLVCEEVGGIQRIIAQKCERGSMELIRAALRHDADLPTRAAAEFRCRNAGLNSELLDRFGDPEVAQCRIDLSVDIADTVE